MSEDNIEESSLEETEKAYIFHLALLKKVLEQGKGSFQLGFL